MPEILDGLGDLSKILFWAAVWTMIWMVIYLAKAIEQGLTDLWVLPFGNPFSGVADLIEGYVVKPLEHVNDKVEQLMASGFAGLKDSLRLLYAAPILLAQAILASLDYLWHTALHAFVTAITNPIVRALNATILALGVLTRVVAENLVKAERYADAQIASAVASVLRTLRAEIHTAEVTAERYASDAVEALRKAEEAALTEAVHALTAGIHAAEAAALAEVNAAERVAASALAQADAVIDASVAGVKRIAVTAEDDALALAGKFGIAGTVGLIASIPLLATLVQTIATESGLDNSSCRGKVKQVCGTDPAAWTRLLDLAAFLTIAFDFREFVDAAETVAQGIGSVIGELEQPFNLALPPLELAA